MYHCLSLCRRHVDTWDYIEIIKSTKKMLSNSFDMKGLGVADVILGIKMIVWILPGFFTVGFFGIGGEEVFSS